MLHRIDYGLVAQAIDFYAHKGFQYVEVPWIVSEAALQTTLPDGKEGLRCADGPLVGSAEQSFIHMAFKGDLPSGKYVAASPCFRGDPPDEWHQRTFFKVELIHIVEQAKGWGAELCEDVPSMPEDEMADIAMEFFSRFEPDCCIVSAPPVPYSEKTVPFAGPVLDITLGGVELGSYGTRGGHSLMWTYGTGLAEPRFSMARAAYNASKR